MEKYLSGMISQKKEKVDQAKSEVKPSKYDKSKRKEEAAKKKAEAEKKAAAMDAKKKPAPKKEGMMSESKPKAEAMVFDTNMDDGGFNDAPKPVKKPPPNIGKKPEPKKKDDDGDEPAEKTDAAPKKGPPALSSSKPAASSGGGGPGKPMTPEMVVEEDLGPGMAKETAMAKCEEFYPADVLAKIAEENKWQEKVEGIQGIVKHIEEQKPDSVIVEATTRYIKAKMKDWKESNLNMKKEAVNVIAAMCANCDDIPKKAYFVYAPYLCDNIGDVKMSGPIKEVLQNIASFVTAKYVAALVMKNALSTKAVNNIKASCEIISVLIDDFGAAQVHLKNVIDFASNSAAHANPAVRTAAL